MPKQFTREEGERAIREVIMPKGKMRKHDGWAFKEHGDSNFRTAIAARLTGATRHVVWTAVVDFYRIDKTRAETMRYVKKHYGKVVMMKGVEVK